MRNIQDLRSKKPIRKCKMCGKELKRADVVFCSLSCSSKRKRTKKHKESISLSIRQKYRDNPEIRKKISAANKGKVSWLKGRKRPIEHIIKTSTKLRGKKRTEQSRARMSDAQRKRTDNRNRGVKLSDEHKLKLSNAHKGKRLTQEHREAISKSNIGKHDDVSVRDRQYRTMKLRGFASKKEEICLNILKNIFSDLKTQYRDIRYKTKIKHPVDVYLPSTDTFIELNFHWTHGCEPYDADNLNHQKTLDEWKEKAITSKFYACAIKVWTLSDVLKRKAAKEKKLNYLEFFKFDTFAAWIKDIAQETVTERTKHRECHEERAKN